jgi:hypothetical protein
MRKSTWASIRCHNTTTYCRFALKEPWKEEAEARARAHAPNPRWSKRTSAQHDGIYSISHVSTANLRPAPKKNLIRHLQRPKDCEH